MMHLRILQTDGDDLVITCVETETNTALAPVRFPRSDLGDALATFEAAVEACLQLSLQRHADRMTSGAASSLTVEEERQELQTLLLAFKAKAEKADP